MDSPNEVCEVAPGIFVVRAPGPPPEPRQIGQPDVAMPAAEQSDLSAAHHAPIAPLPQPSQWRVSIAPPNDISAPGPRAMNHKILAAYPELCIGCRKCELACAEFHVGKPDAAYSRIRVTSIEEERRDFPTICMHC
jgi:NAD-dependent dihydropyrimidine dehydrogenase PreA subunit